MLMLQRRSGEKIHIGDDIIVYITEVRGIYVKLGIEAPREIVILRDEIKERIEKGINNGK